MATLTKPSPPHSLTQREANTQDKTAVVGHSGVSLTSVARGKSGAESSEKKPNGAAVLHFRSANNVNSTSELKHSESHHPRGGLGLNSLQTKDSSSPTKTDHNSKNSSYPLKTNSLGDSSPTRNTASFHNSGDCADSTNRLSDAFSCVPPPLPPVSLEMAEAIKRQQRGEGAVKYWKAKQIQATETGQIVNSKSGRRVSGIPPTPSGVGGIPDSLLPTLKQFFYNGHGNGHNGLNVGGVGVRFREVKTGGRNNKDRWKQRAAENILAPSRTTLYGGSLGHYPLLSSTYKRSVTSLGSLPPPPSTFSSHHPHPPPLPPQLPPHSSSYFSGLQRETQQDVSLHEKSQMENRERLRTLNRLEGDDQLLSQGQGRLQGRNQTEGQSHVHDQSQGRLQSQGPGDGKNNSVVTELTCLQLADTILRTKTADLSRIYQLCQTKIRYMDYLERTNEAFKDPDNKSPDAQTDEKTGTNLPKPPVPYTLRLRGAKDATQRGSPVGTDYLNRDPSGPDESSSVSLPAISSGPMGLASRSLTSLSPRSLWNSEESKEIDYSRYLPQNTVVCKPILKPPPQDDPIFGGRAYDPFSSRHDNGYYGDDLRVRGTTMYPLDGRWSSRRTHSSRGTTDLRRRAVRFSISDQVKEFTPSEPLIP